MRTATLEVLRPGLLTTVQDLGRWGYQAVGVPVAGAMDTRSLRWANALAGNADDAAGLEITLMGPTLRLHGQPVRGAVVGATVDVHVDDVLVDTSTAFDLHEGATLRVGRCRNGARAYLAIGGGIATPSVLGSRATHLVSRMGGLDGRALAVGDRLPVGPSPVGAAPVSMAPRRWSALTSPVTLRVLLGPQDAWFTHAAVAAFFEARFTISAASDRMGFRLDGPRLEIARGDQLLSEPVAFGAIQVPASGQPILLMADRQTAGGYPKIATVIAADLPLAGQLAPGDAVCFAACSRHEALAALIAEERRWMRGSMAAHASETR